MLRRTVRSLLIAFLLIATLGCGTAPDAVELINVSYDPTRELYQEINSAFIAEQKAAKGLDVSIKQLHGGSGAQARAVIDGLQADVVTLALANDIDVLSEKKLVAGDWQSRLDHQACPYTSTIVLLVRAGNPKNIRDWPDLARPGVQVITPNPKTGGGARWNFLAAWGFVSVHQKGTEQQATDLVRDIYRNVVKLDSGARGSTDTFVRRGVGDVFISWENEALFIQKQNPSAGYEIVLPSASILAEPPVAVVDVNVDKRKTRATAEEYLRFLYTPAGQEIIARHGYRPQNEEIRSRYSATLPKMTLFTIRDIAGSWAAAQKKFFAEKGVFDAIYQRSEN